MKYQELGNTGMNISKIVYGGIVSAGYYDGVLYDEYDQKASDTYVNYALDHGINYFDVAPTYGNAEEQLGNSLIGHRDEVYLACKSNIREYKGAKEDMKKTLELLHTDYIDVYQLHGVTTMEEVETAFGPGGIMELMEEMKSSGVAKHIGFTAHSEECALEMLRRYPFETILFPMNWLMNMKKGMGSRLAEAVKENNVGLLGMKFMIDRAWDSDEERKNSRYPKSWCKPFYPEDEELIVAAMRYSLSMGAVALDPPGNFESFSFAVEHLDKALEEELTERDKKLLEERFALNSEKLFF